MPKRKGHDDNTQASIYTFKLANGEPFDVQGVKTLVEQLVYKSIDLTNKRLKEQGDFPLGNGLDDESFIPKDKVKKRRRRYSREDKRQMIALFDKYPVKEAAMEVINSITGFEKVTPAMIISWKKPQPVAMKKMGRQVDIEFESEVLLECEKMSNNHIQNLNEMGATSTTGAGSGAVASTLGLTYAVVRECAMTVWERFYPDENGQLVPKWKICKTTRGLKFSHKWVIGLMKRVQAANAAGVDGGSLTLGGPDGPEIPAGLVNRFVLTDLPLDATEHDGDETEDDDEDDSDDDSDNAGLHAAFHQ